MNLVRARGASREWFYPLPLTPDALRRDFSMRGNAAKFGGCYGLYKGIERIDQEG
jgi:hypothetical protein